MQLLPGLKISNCPCCNSLNIIKVNGITYNNSYKSLENYILKKIFHCRKCKEKLGLFIKQNFEKNSKSTKVLWLDSIECEDKYYPELKKLEEIKNKYTKIKNKKYFEALNEIYYIKNKINKEQIKLRVRLKIQKKGMLIRHVY